MQSLPPFPPPPQLPLGFHSLRSISSANSLSPVLPSLDSTDWRGTARSLKYSWIFKLFRNVHLHDGCGPVTLVQKVMYFGEFCYVNSSWIRKSITLWVPRGINSRFCTKARQQMFLLVSVRHGAHPGGWAQHGVSIQISINLGKTFLRISRIRNILLTWILAKVFVYLPPFISQIPNFIFWTVFIFIFIWSTVFIRPPCGPFLESPGNLSGPKSNFQIEI